MSCPSNRHYNLDFRMIWCSQSSSVRSMKEGFPSFGKFVLPKNQSEKATKIFKLFLRAKRYSGEKRSYILCVLPFHNFLANDANGKRQQLTELKAQHEPHCP